MKTEYPYTEERVAAALGVTRERVAELRKECLFVDTDVQVRRTRILYSQAAIGKLVQALGGLPKEAPAEAARLLEKKTAPAEAPLLDAVVTRVYGRNRQYLEASLGGRAIQVRVRSNERFVEGMTIESRALVMVNERVFDFVGRLPRARGRW